MTTRELIAKLETLPDDLPIYVADWQEGYSAPISFDDCSIKVADIHSDWDHDERRYLISTPAILIDAKSNTEGWK